MQIRSLAVTLPSYRILLLSSIMVRIYGNGRHFRDLYYRSRVSGGRANFRETPVTCVTACLSPARLRSSRAAAVGGDLFGGAVRQVIFKLVGLVRRLLYGSGATAIVIQVRQHVYPSAELEQ